jgi:peroxiredoxin
MALVPLGIGVSVAVVLITVVSVLTGGKVVDTQGRAALDGTTIKTFTLPGLEGGRVSAPWHEGHPAVVLFFASWCTICQAELPGLSRSLDRHQRGGVEVFGVDALDSTGPARTFVDHDHLTFPVGVDVAGDLTKDTFGFNGLPETVFVDAKGVVVGVRTGAISRAQLASGIASIERG